VNDPIRPMEGDNFSIELRLRPKNVVQRFHKAVVKALVMR
jgi:hypothetical protein